MFRGILLYFIKGFGNAMCCILPYHIKNPYEDAAGSIARDWKFVAGDIRRTAKKIKQEN